jgi:hypothetical protein
MVVSYSRLLLKIKRFGMGKKKFVNLLLLSFFIFTNSFGVDVFLRSDIFSKNYFSIEVVLGQWESIYKDSIKMSVDSIGCKIKDFEVLSDFVEEYVPQLKSHKNIYKNSFFINVFFDGEKKFLVGSCFLFSCFILRGGEEIFPFFKEIELPCLSRANKTKLPKKTSFFLNRIKNIYLKKTGSADRPIRVFNTRFLLSIFIIFLFLCFFVVQVLTFSDIFPFFLLGCFILVGRFIFPYFLILTLSAFSLLLISFRLFKKRNNILGFISGAAVLPLLVEAYLVF